MSRPVTIALSFALAAGLAGVAFAQGSAHHGPSGAPGGPPHHALAQTCDGAFEENVRDGRGFGMAFVADQQGYPGPLHVLELEGPPPAVERSRGEGPGAPRGDVCGVATQEHAAVECRGQAAAALRRRSAR